MELTNNINPMSYAALLSTLKFLLLGFSIFAAFVSTLATSYKSKEAMSEEIVQIIDVITCTVFFLAIGSVIMSGYLGFLAFNFAEQIYQNHHNIYQFIERLVFYYYLLVVFWAIILAGTLLRVGLHR